LSNKVDHEARNREEKANKHGRDFVENEQLSERQKDQLREGREKLRKAAKRREEDHKKSLVANLGPVSIEQAKDRLRSLKEILTTVPETDRYRKSTLTKEAEKLEATLLRGTTKK
jgi:hypothetical protein